MSAPDNAIHAGRTPAHQRAMEGSVNLRTYHAPSIAQALGQIKRELGPDAVILHTRTYKRGGFLGFGGRSQVEITASNNVNVRRPRVKRNAIAPAASAAPSSSTAAPLMNPSAQSLRRAYQTLPIESASPGLSANDSVTLDSAGETSCDETPANVAQASRDVAQAVVAAATNQAVDPALMRDELVSIKRLVGQVLRASHGASAPALPEALTAMYLQLIEADVASEIADEVVSDVRAEMSTAQLADVDHVREQVLRRLERFITVADDTTQAGKMTDGRPLTVALVGPTGVGKTTTIAKLAATYKLRHARRVGLVTCDTYRIAAVEQLRTYANIIGLPLNVALTPREMSSCCAALNDCDVILIDTAGRSPHDGDRLDELGDLLKAADPHETHLVLSGTSSEAVLSRAAERFKVAQPNCVILTKLDETVNFGVLVNVAHRIGAALSYITTGQEVPDHIEPGRPERLAKLVLDGGYVR